MTDVQENNILLSISPSDPTFEEFATKEQSNPSPHKVLDPNHIIHTSRNLHPNAFGRPVLCDFGEARYIKEGGYSEDIQPIQYRAPEVILGVPWNEKVDIWSVGVMVSTSIYVGSRIFLNIERCIATNVRSGTYSRQSTCSLLRSTHKIRMPITLHVWLHCLGLHLWTCFVEVTPTFLGNTSQKKVRFQLPNDRSAVGLLVLIVVQASGKAPSIYPKTASKRQKRT